MLRYHRLQRSHAAGRRPASAPRNRTRVTILPGLLLASLLHALPVTAQPVAQLLLRPPDARVSVRPSQARAWIPGVHMQVMRQGDSIRVESGSAEIVFRTGARTRFARDERGIVVPPSSQDRNANRSLGAAVRAMIEFTVGADHTGPQPHRLEAPTQAEARPGGFSEWARSRVRNSVEVIRSSPGEVRAPTDSLPVSADAAVVARVLELYRQRGRPRNVPYLPGDMTPWVLLPSWPAIDWPPSGRSPSDPLLVRVYPAASPQRGCPPAGQPVLDMQFVSAAVLRDSLRSRVQAGDGYRVEFGSGMELRTGCISFATLDEEREMFAQLRELRTQFGDAEAIDSAGVEVLQAGLLAGMGYYADALLRLAPLIQRGDAPPAATQLWAAILARESVW